jgi:hypothetical protein
MKILIVGQFKNWALEHHYVRYLSQLAEVVTYPAEDVFDDYYWASVFNKITFKLGLSSIQQKIARELVKKTETEKPDVVWVFKGMRILPAALKKLREKGFALANYNADDPFFFFRPGSGNRNVANSIGLYDLHFSYHQGIRQRIEKEFGIPTAYLPFAFELPSEVFDQVKNEPEILRACFIGNPDNIRTNYLKALLKSGVEVDVYGHAWERFLSPVSNLKIHDACYGIDFWQKVRSYRLQVNIFRPHNEGSHNMRTFEVPAAGGIMLAPDSPEHQAFFTPGEEFFTYHSVEELVEAAKNILRMPLAQANNVRENARRRSLTSGYAYEHRAMNAYKALESLLAFKNGRLQGNGKEQKQQESAISRR